MEPNRPIFDPGDQKTTGHDFPVPSSRKANRIYLFVMLGLMLLGIGCLVIEEYVAGAIMTAVGVIAASLFARAELSERAMVRRMRKRGE